MVSGPGMHLRCLLRRPEEGSRECRTQRHLYLQASVLLWLRTGRSLTLPLRPGEKMDKEVRR